MFSGIYRLPIWLFKYFIFIVIVKSAVDFIPPAEDLLIPLHLEPPPPVDSPHQIFIRLPGIKQYFMWSFFKKYLDTKTFFYWNIFKVCFFAFQMKEPTFFFTVFKWKNLYSGWFFNSYVQYLLLNHEIDLVSLKFLIFKIHAFMKC